MTNSNNTSQETISKNQTSQSTTNAPGIDKSRSILIILVCIAVCVGFYFLGKLI